MFDIEDINDALVESIIKDVSSSLIEKGYNPINQLVGYLITGDETYITSFNKARDLIKSVDRSKMLETIVRRYLNN